jgi:hypothetical protein
VSCWQCGARLSSEPPTPEPVDQNIDFSASVVQPTAPPKKRRKLFTLTGEEVEVEETVVETPSKAEFGVAARIGQQELLQDPSRKVIRLTFCKNCGLENEEGSVECRQCKQELEVVAQLPGPVVMPPRAWGFDVLGVVWIALGVWAVLAGQFLIKANTQHKGITLEDYLWTGAVVAAPGVLIFMRHFFCKLLFYVMTLLSIMVWSVLGLIWIIGRLTVTDNQQVGLQWLAGLSALSFISWIIVRTNDAFDRLE